MDLRELRRTMLTQDPTLFLLHLAWPFREKAYLVVPDNAVLKIERRVGVYLSDVTCRYRTPQGCSWGQGSRLDDPYRLAVL